MKAIVKTPSTILCGEGSIVVINEKQLEMLGSRVEEIVDNKKNKPKE